MQVTFKQHKLGFAGDFRAGKQSLSEMPEDAFKAYLRRNLETPSGRIWLSLILDHTIEELTEYAGSEPEKPIRRNKKR
jgi:hypothetical protein